MSASQRCCRSAAHGHYGDVQLSRTDLADFSYFLAIAKHRSFRRAGLEARRQRVGAQPFAERPGSAARRAAAQSDQPQRHADRGGRGAARGDLPRHFDAIGTAVDVLNRYRDEPAGRIRLNVLEHASALLLAPVLPVSSSATRDIEVDVAVTQPHGRCGRGRGRRRHPLGRNRARGYGRAAAVARHPLGGGGAPSYLERLGTPASSARPAAHNCLRFRLGRRQPLRLGVRAAATRVADRRAGRDHHRQQRVRAGSRPARGRARLSARAASVAAMWSAGDLRIVLADWASIGPGFHIYYPGRRQLPTGLRLLIDLIRELRPLGAVTRSMSIAHRFIACSCG